MADQLGQLLMTGVPGPVLDAQTAATFRRIQPGAFILFGRNIQTPSQLRKLCDDLRDVSRRLTEARGYLRVDELRSRIAELEIEISRPDLWDDQENAQAVTSKHRQGVVCQLTEGRAHATHQQRDESDQQQGGTTDARQNDRDLLQARIANTE